MPFVADPPPPRAIIFDWDNTLVDNWSAITAALNRVRADFGMSQWTREDAISELRLSQRDNFPRLFGAGWERARDSFYRYFETDHVDHLVVLPGAVELLEWLKDTGTYTAIVSNKTGRYLRAEIAHLGWEGYFAASVGALDASADKPDPAPVTLALGPSTYAFGPDIWFLGDADVDIQCANDAGLTGVLVHEDEDHANTLAATWHLSWVKSCHEAKALMMRARQGI